MHTDGHHDSMTESAQWADSVKIIKKNIKRYIALLSVMHLYTYI